MRGMIQSMARKIHLPQVSMITIKVILVRNTLMKNKNKREVQPLSATIASMKLSSDVLIRHATVVDTMMHTTVHSCHGHLDSMEVIHIGVGDYHTVTHSIMDILTIIITDLIIIVGTIPITTILIGVAVTIMGITITIIILPITIMFIMDTATQDHPIHIIHQGEDHPLHHQPIAVLQEIQAIVPGQLVHQEVPVLLVLEPVLLRIREEQ